MRSLSKPMKVLFATRQPADFAWRRADFSIAGMSLMDLIAAGKKTD